MKNLLRILSTVGFLATCLLFLISCANLTKKNALPEAVRLQLKGKPGDVVKTRYVSKSRSKNFHQGQVTKEKEEEVEFTLVERVKSIDLVNNRITIESTSQDKDGIVDLHDLAFPEVDEVIEYIYQTDAKVLKAGGYPDWSVFYVSPLPLPSKEVRVGDTWEMNDEWRSLKNGIPLQVSLVAILKSLKPCGQNLCAQLEISGDVGLVGAPPDQIQFVSEVKGEVLFDIDRGIPVQSRIESEEDLRMANDQTVVSSTVESRVID